MNEQLVSAIKRAANKTTESDPIVRLPNERLHNMMRRGLINFSNQLNTQGQVAALTGQPFREEEHQLALTYEPGAVTKMFRVIIVKKSLFLDLDRVGDNLRFALPYHQDRIVALKAIRAEMNADQNREGTSKVLAPFMVSAPVFKSGEG